MNDTDFPGFENKDKKEPIIVCYLKSLKINNKKTLSKFKQRNNQLALARAKERKDQLLLNKLIKNKMTVSCKQ